MPIIVGVYGWVCYLLLPFPSGCLKCTYWLSGFGIDGFLIMFGFVDLGIGYFGPYLGWR